MLLIGVRGDWQGGLVWRFWEKLRENLPLRMKDGNGLFISILSGYSYGISRGPFMTAYKIEGNPNKIIILKSPINLINPTHENISYQTKGQGKSVVPDRVLLYLTIVPVTGFEYILGYTPY